MKTSDAYSLAPAMPSLFQIAAFFEEFFPRWQTKAVPPSVSQLPFAQFMLNPENLWRLLKSGAAKPGKKDAAVAPDKYASRAKRPARSFSGGKPASRTLPKANGAGSGWFNSSPVLPKKVEFIFKSPLASSVRLAGDFTDWEKRPVEMMHSEGVWFTVVPLMPGRYHYRYIVDGRWCDDPISPRVANPFGTENAVVHVA